MEREVSQDRSRAIEVAKKKSENLMTQATRDSLEDSLVQAEKRLLEARAARIPANEDGREATASDYSFRQHMEADAEVNKLKSILKSSRLISPRQQTDVIKMGNSAKVKLIQEDITVDVTMLGKNDILEGAIHLGQPLADAIYGRRAGEIVSYTGHDTDRRKVQLSAEIMKVLPGQFEAPRDPAQRKSS